MRGYVNERINRRCYCNFGSLRIGVGPFYVGSIMGFVRENATASEIETTKVPMRKKRLTAEQLENIKSLIEELEYPSRLEDWGIKACDFLLACADTLRAHDQPNQAKLAENLFVDFQMIRRDWNPNDQAR